MKTTLPSPGSYIVADSASILWTEENKGYVLYISSGCRHYALPLDVSLIASDDDLLCAAEELFTSAMVDLLRVDGSWFVPSVATFR